jgi:hypothetical protein
MSHKKIENCIAACTDCAVEAAHCITACLHESDVKTLARCIQLNQDCKAICLLEYKQWQVVANLLSKYANCVKKYVTPVLMNASNTAT